MKSSVLKVLVAVIAVSAIALFSFKSSDQDESDVVIIRAVQAGGLLASGIYIYDQNGTIEQIEMEKLKKQENQDNNWKTIAGVLESYIDKGYSIKTGSDNVGGGTFMNTYVLTK